MTDHVSPPATAAETLSELRWSQWVANVAMADAILHRRAVAAAVLLGCSIGVWLGVVIYLG